MAQNKAKEFIVNEINLEMLEDTISRLNILADMIRDSYDMNYIGRALRELFKHCEREVEPINGHEEDFCFTMCYIAKPLDKRKKVLKYRYRLNTYTNDITCIDEFGNDWTMPLLNDALSVIREKTIAWSMQ